MSSKIGKRSAGKIKLDSYEDLFGSGEGQDSATEQIKMVVLSELYPFPNHPFRVVEDEAMQELIESIQMYGVLVPAIVRTRAEGGYELIAGHRRTYASKQAGKTELPVLIREYSNEEATILMVDSNLQREELLPSEKAKAYQMKYRAKKHQGSKAGGHTLEELGEVAGKMRRFFPRFPETCRVFGNLL